MTRTAHGGYDVAAMVSRALSIWVRVAIVGLLLAALAPSAPLAADQPSRPNPLAGLPSPPGPHVQRLKDLAPGSWIELGAPSPDPRWGKARGRTWTTNMAYAPSLKGAFLFGEGVHGYVDPRTGRYMDGLWLYDIMAHRWITVHPGTDTRNPPTLTVNADGFVADADGNPLPIATLTHGYEMTAWDPVRRRFVSMPARGSNYFKRALPTFYAFLAEAKDRLNRDHAGPWMFDVDRAVWLRTKTKSPSPASMPGDTVLFISSVDALFFRHARRREVWFYHLAREDWRRAGPTGPNPPFGIDATSCYDPKRDRVYLGGGGYPATSGPNALWTYDIKTDRWADPAPGGYAVGTYYGTNGAMLHCDLAADQVLLFRYRGEDRGVFAYDPETNQWRKSGELPAAWPAFLIVNGSSGFYAPDLNVHFFHLAGDSRENGRILAYRHTEGGAEHPR